MYTHECHTFVDDESDLLYLPVPYKRVKFQAVQILRAVLGQIISIPVT